MIIQVELTESNRMKLDTISSRSGKTTDQLLNDAVSRLLEDTDVPAAKDWRASLAQAAGMWKDRTDLPDFVAVRHSFDRDFGQDKDE